MKTFLAMCLLSIIVFAQASDEVHTETPEQSKHDETQKCGEIQVDQEILEKSDKGDFINDPKFKEQLYCFYKKFGILSESGEYQIDAIEENLTKEYNEEVAKTVLAACTKKSYDNKYDTAFEFAKCCYHTLPKEPVKV